ncbi:hypothetical protein BO221_15750 [Archangium sp. Cb G35]|nr:hypothetical protein BO221_15750 [Archangium sp. Cb G35]
MEPGVGGVMAAVGLGVVGVSCLLGYLSGLERLPGFTVILLGTGLIIAGLRMGARRGVRAWRRGGA